MMRFFICVLMKLFFEVKPSTLSPWYIEKHKQ